MPQCSDDLLHEQLRLIRQQLRCSMNGQVSRLMREHGLSYRLNFGVEIPRLRTMAGELPHDAALALALWKEDVRECRILALMLFPEDEFPYDLAEIWADQLRNAELACLASHFLFSRLPYAPQMAMRWVASEDRLRRVSGFHVIARLLLLKPSLSMGSRNEIMDQALAGSMEPDADVRQAALSCLRYFLRLSEQHAFDLCRRIDGLSSYAESGPLVSMIKSEMAFMPDSTV